MRVGFINTNNLPPNGYAVYEARTGWSSTPYTGLEATVTEVQRHREANKGRFPDWPLDRASIERFVLQFTEARLRSMPGGEAWLAPGPAESPPPVNFLPRRLPRQRSPAAVEGVKQPVQKVVAGIALITDWLGSGLKPVEQARADHRASICARCVLNQKPAELITSVMADGLHLLMEAKAHMKLATPHDALLETCTACLCRNSLKVWTPIEHVKAHTTPEILTALAEPCWIRDELKVST